MFKQGLIVLLIAQTALLTYLSFSLQELVQYLKAVEEEE